MSPGNKSSGKAKDRVTLNCALRERRVLIFFFVFFRRIAGVRACLYVVRSSGGGGRATYLERSSSRCILCALLRRCITVSFFIATTQKMHYLGTGCFLCPGTKEYIHVYKIPAIFFTTKRINGKMVPIRFFLYFQTCFSFPNVTHVCLFFLSFLLGKRGGGGTSPQFNAGRVITDSVASSDMIAIGGCVWNRWRALPRKNAAIFFPQRILSFLREIMLRPSRHKKGGISPLQHKREKRTFFQFCSTSRRGQPRRTKKGQIGAPPPALKNGIFGWI